MSSHSNEHQEPSGIAKTPEPPYYAVIFSSLRTAGDKGYGDMAEQMSKLASVQPGFLGVESARDSDGLGITVSYWESLDAIKNWKANPLHLTAQDKGRTDWYASYGVRISRVERNYFF